VKKIEVSIILPNFNSSKYLSQTISSILKQSYNKWNLYIVDDASDERTLKILNNYKKNKKIKIFYLKKNMGAAYCRNFAIKKSKSEFLAFIDSDDIWKKNKLKNQINFMKKNKFSFTYTNYLSYYEKNAKYKKITAPSRFDFEDFIKNTTIATSSMIVKRKFIRNIFFTNTKICEDYFFKCKILKKVKYAYRLNDYSLIYRVRPGSLQSSRLSNFFWIWKINKMYNNFNFFKNLSSLINISINSIIKYGFK
tara:strand:+ start:1113 stop:1865 length:753 start_codon:yes stop_codon:yes gene_type:complete